MGNMDDVDMQGVEPSQFGAVPKGEYVAKIKETDRAQIAWKQGDDPNAKPNFQLKVEYQIAEGQYKGKVIKHNMGLWNYKSPESMRIAKEQLATIYHSLGIQNVRNHEELRGRIIVIRVDCKTETYFKDGQEVTGEKNEVKGFKPYTQGGQPAAAQPAAAATHNQNAPQHTQAQSQTAANPVQANPNPPQGQQPEQQPAQGQPAQGQPVQTGSAPASSNNTAGAKPAWV